MSPTTEIELDIFWLQFDSKKRIISGSPTKNDTDTIYVTIFANDGLKNGNDTFVLTISSSMHVSNNANGFPLVISNISGNMIQAQIKSNDNTKILLSMVYQNSLNLNYFNASSDQRTIIMNGTDSQINSALFYLAFREDISKRLLSTSLSADLTLMVADSFNQVKVFNLPKSFLKNDSAQIIVHSEYSSSNYLVEIGSFFKLSLSKAIFVQNDPNIRLNYTFILTDKAGNNQNFLILDQNLNLVSLKSIEESLIGNYRATVNATDEFNDYALLRFTIEVNYSLSEIISQWFKNLAGFLSSLLSIVTIYKFYYLFFNWWFAKNNEMNDEIVIIDRYFKRKYPFILQEYTQAQNALKKYLKTIDSKKRIPKTQTEIEDQIKEIMPLIPHQYLIKDLFLETVECILEGLIIINIMEHTPSAKKMLYAIKSRMEKHQMTKNKKSHSLKQWFTEFFLLETSLSKKVDVEIAKTKESNFPEIDQFLLQKGKYKRVEKHCFFNEEVFNHFYEASLKSIKVNSIEDAKAFRELMIKAIILYKRGILLDTSPIFLYLDRFLSKITLNCVSFVHGDSIHADEKFIQEISSKWLTPTFVSKIFGTLFAMNRNFFSVSNKNVPPWIEIIQKQGILIFKGVPILGEQNRHYIIEVIGPNSKNLFKFWIRVYRTENEFDKGLKKSMTMTESVRRRKNTAASLNEHAAKFKLDHRLNTRKSFAANELLKSKSPTSAQFECSGLLMSPTIIESKGSNSKEEVSKKYMRNESRPIEAVMGDTHGNLITEKEKD